MEYYDTISTAGGQSTPVSTTGYDYNVAGNPTRIIAKPVASSTYSAKRFEYAKNGQAVTYVLGETWEWDGVPAHCPTNYDITFAREFRYDSGRARYLNRVLSPAGLMLPTPDFTPVSETWSDYDEDEVYGDFTVGGSTVTNDRSFELGVATVDPWAEDEGTNTSHFHTDHLGTTRGLTNSSATFGSGVVYTAFGEKIDGTNHRYGYVGSSGYQSYDFPSGNPIPFLHVGARYYDPSSGRFLQRDPIGIHGGFNVYVYATSEPVDQIDASGLSRHSYRDAAGRFARKPWWRRGMARWGPIGTCGWLAIEVSDRIIVPAIDGWADRRYEEGMDELNRDRYVPQPLPPPTSPPNYQPPAFCNRCHGPPELPGGAR